MISQVKIIISKSPKKLQLPREKRWYACLPDLNLTIFGYNQQDVLEKAKSEASKNFNLNINSIHFLINNAPTQSSFWRNLMDWIREKPYFTYFVCFLEIIILFFVVFYVLLAVFKMIEQIHLLLNNEIAFVALLAAILGFLGVAITNLCNAWNKKHDTAVEKQKTASDKMSKDYETIVKILKNPNFYEPAKVFNFIDRFDNLVEIYSSSKVFYHWKKIRDKIKIFQSEPWKANNEDLLTFTNLICAIREEMGYTSRTETRSILYTD
jgi:hypothetical protein